MLSPEDLARELKRFLPGRRWFGSKDSAIEEVIPHKLETMRAEWPALVHSQMDVLLSGGQRDRYQVLVGLRPQEDPGLAQIDREAVIGLFNTEAGPAYGYDAVDDPELAIEIFTTIRPEAAPPERVEPIKGEQSNSSLVYDGRLILKIFRRLSEDPNLDLEVTQALGETGFRHIAAPLAVWRDGDVDLAMIQPFLSGVDGWALAMTSLNDLYGGEGDPAQSGGDFAPEAQLLGMTIAELHHAMAEAFGTWPADPPGWAQAMEGQLDRVSHPDLDKSRALEVFNALEGVTDPGPSVRVHGDLHLAQAMRTEWGWHVLDFEGEPARPIQERRQPTSPLKDVAGILRSLHYAAWSAMLRSDTKSVETARAWEERNRQAFLNGYQEVSGGAERESILPGSKASFDLILKAFELDRGIYEVGYEMANRPTWVEVPLAAVSGLY
jgi:maltokinase